MATNTPPVSWGNMATQELQRMFYHPELANLVGQIGSPYPMTTPRIAPSPASPPLGASAAPAAAAPMPVSWGDMATQELQRMFSHPELRSIAAGLIGHPRPNYDAITGMAPTGTSTDYSDPGYSAPLGGTPPRVPQSAAMLNPSLSAMPSIADTRYLPPVQAPQAFDIGERLAGLAGRIGAAAESATLPGVPPPYPMVAPRIAPSPASPPLGAPPSEPASFLPASPAATSAAPSTGLPAGVRAMSAAGAPYFRNDTLGAPLLSDSAIGATAAGWGAGPASLNALVASQRPDLYNPDGTPRQVGFGGQAVDPGLTQAVEAMQRLSASMGLTGQSSHAGVVVGGMSPEEQAIQDIKRSNLSEGTQLRRIAEVRAQGLQDTINQRNANTELERARIAAETQRANIGEEVAARRDIAKSTQETALEKARIMGASRSHETVEDIPIRIQPATDPTNPAKSSFIATQGNYVGQGSSAQEAQANLQERILAPFMTEFPNALANPDVLSRMQEKYKTKDVDKLRTEYLRDALRMATTRVRRTQPMSDYGAIGTSSEE